MECRNCLKYNGKACEFGMTWPCGAYVPHVINPSDKQGDLISRSALIEEIENASANDSDWWYLGKIEDAPAVDAVPVVRCKDCKHYMTIHCTCDGCCISDYWYCADGERKDNATD